MNAIIVPVLLVMAVGFVLAVVLTIASKVFFVPVDETVANLRAELPGANCGACGFAGCDDYANALAENPELGTGLCPVGGAGVAAKLAEVLGVEAGSMEPQVAVVMCNGNADAAKTIMEYQGLSTCAAAKTMYGGLSACAYGCMGLGVCAAACPYGAIQVCNGVAVVNRELCVGCGICASSVQTVLSELHLLRTKLLFSVTLKILVLRLEKPAQTDVSDARSAKRHVSLKLLRLKTILQ